MAFIGYVEVILAVVCFLIFRSLRKNSLPTNWPIFGMLPFIAQNIDHMHDNCTQIMALSNGSFKFKGPWFANMDMLISTDPANVHHVMSANFSNYPKGPEFAKMFDILGDGIFNADHESWKNQRKLARLFINHQQFQEYLVKTGQNKVEKGLVPFLEYVSDQGPVVDLQDLFQRYTFDTTCILVTGNDPGCLSIELPEIPFAKALDDAEEVLFIRHFVPKSINKLMAILGIGHEKKMTKAWKTLDHVIQECLTAKKEEIVKKSNLTNEKGEEDGLDLLTSYLKDVDSVYLKRDDKFLRDTVLNLMIAGRDTTSSALTWFSWLVFQNPIVLGKIREELKKVVPIEEAHKHKIFTVEELNKLPYLHGALCEALRLYPPVPYQHKEPVKPDILPSGHKVDPKMKVLFHIYAMGRMEFIWGKDCLNFKPERWISEGGTIEHKPSYKFFAFNAGPRTCLGKDVAFIQAKAVAAALIYNYNVEMVKGHVVEPNTSIILYMKHGLKVNITKRWINEPER